MSDSDDCDWFDKDDDALMRDFERNMKAKEAERMEEHIKVPTNNLDNYIKELTLKASSSHTKKSGNANKKKCNIAELRKINALSPLDQFLYTHTMEYDFYSGQLQPNDSQEKVILYTSILAAICRLELPGFQKPLLQAFRDNICLQEHLRLLLAKLFCKRFKDMWKQPKDMEYLLENIELLFIQSCSSETINVGHDKEQDMLKDLLKILDKSDNDLAVCKKYKNRLKENLQALVDNAKSSETSTWEIYPTIDELLNDASQCNGEDMTKSLLPVQQYLNRHMQFLKEDFLLPLRECVKYVKSSASQCPDNFHLFDDVFIVLNEQFLDANRHELLFVDILGSRRNLDDDGNTNIPWEVQEKLWKIKSGALLCFTTSRDFDNLILATVTYTSQDCLKEGYIGIEIARQHNIGNIYKRPLLMFETPAFFEPYHNVFNYLKNCNSAEFPMKQYIVDEEHPTTAPKYLTNDTLYQCNGQKFHPLRESLEKNTLELNLSQLEAFSKALKQEFALIQGPPGTGKTYLSVQIVKTLIENAETPLILITYTNESLDKFLVKLSAFTENIVRFGSQTRDQRIAKYNVKDVVEHSLINPKLKRLYYLCSLEFKEAFGYLQQKHREFDGADESYGEILKAQSKLAEVSEKLRTLKTMFQYYVAREKSIIGMTTTCAAKTNFLFRLLKSKIVIFEEAAEILESHIVACLTPHTQHVIMIGDHQQLQPYTSNYQLQQKTQMNISLFERIFCKHPNPIVLRTQYRMHPKIADLLSNTIYKDLDSDESVTHYPAIRQMSTNLFFMNHNKPEAKTEQDSSLYNPYEVTQVVQLSLHLVQNALYNVEDIQILSPYARQIEMIRKQLQQHPSLQALKACTVDSFQGLECNIVILSLVRSNSTSQIGFLKQSNRICVALSRAKHAMYCIGNLDLLSQCSTIWKEIAEKLQHHKAVGDKFPIESENYFYDK
ncbi:NFX1-type zinc finger-containing protein 1-like [Musca domestica]|uniref:NFX1-type zinc finger-containing protein 1-like n=1 Tax=Musca domestica TaxID=7370 RepID=A0ABM3US45_MUSDO|nr:NFX1-type zinc finger-containing protein 1-like [Musca domestica]XP_058976344.1 NFX1-type zinc finger-containing protein 1-like [Musca domestica]